MREDGLTDMEGAVMDSLCDAVEAFDLLETQHPDETRDFYDCVHRMQDLMAVRVCRRLYPNGWVTYGPEFSVNGDG